MSDPVKRPLQFPVWHIPYLEKHRIYELFHEVAKELVIQKPDDHVLFTKQMLINAAKCRDVPRVVLLHVPKVNTLEVAKEIAKVTNQVVISETNLRNCLGRDVADVPSEIIVRCLAYLVRTENCYNRGWIMVNCIRSEDDAKNLLQLGIIPTHVIQLIAPFHPKLSDILYCHVRSDWPEYRRNLAGIKYVFQASLREVYLENHNLKEVVTECVNLCKLRKAAHGITPRVVIIGPRGSGRKTQAVHLHENMDLVHVDFEYLLCQSWKSPSELGEKLRKCKNEVCFHSELLCQVVNHRILQEDCLRKGWVLTGFPYTETDLRYLDSLDTPPNRIVLLECDLNVCRERLRHRKVDVYSGSVIDLRNDPGAEEVKVLKTHPKDTIDVINAELNYYCQNYGSIRKYCGSTASVVNGDQNERWVNECITALILRSPPAAPPRTGLSDLGSVSSDGSTDCDCISDVTKIVDCFVKKI